MGNIIHKFELGVHLPLENPNGEIQHVSDLRLVEHASNNPNRSGGNHYWATDENGKSVHLSAERILNAYGYSSDSDYVYTPITANLDSPVENSAVDSVDIQPSVSDPEVTRDPDTSDGNAVAVSSVVASLASRFPLKNGGDTNAPDDTDKDPQQDPQRKDDNPYGYHEGPGSLADTYLNPATDGSEKQKKDRRSLGLMARMAILGASTKVMTFVHESKQSAAESVAEMSPRNKKIAKVIGAVAGLAAIGVGAYLITKGIMGNSNGGTTSTEATEVSRTFPPKFPGLDAHPYVKAPANMPPAPSVTSVETAITLPNPSNPTTETMFMVPTPKVAEFSNLDASSIKVSGNVMPYTNSVAAGASNPGMTSQSVLEQYNIANNRSFSLGQGGMYWEGNHIMNPSELEQYNALMHKLAEAADQLDEASGSLPSTL